jgi:hypothetical protein
MENNNTVKVTTVSDFDINTGVTWLALAKSVPESYIRKKYTVEEIVKLCFRYSATGYGFSNTKFDIEI